MFGVFYVIWSVWKFRFTLNKGPAWVWFDLLFMCWLELLLYNNFELWKISFTDFLFTMWKRCFNICISCVGRLVSRLARFQHAKHEWLDNIGCHKWAKGVFSYNITTSNIVDVMYTFSTTGPWNVNLIKNDNFDVHDCMKNSVGQFTWYMSGRPMLYYTMWSCHSGYKLTRFYTPSPFC